MQEAVGEEEAPNLFSGTCLLCSYVQDIDTHKYLATTFGLCCSQATTLVAHV